MSLRMSAGCTALGRLVLPTSRGFRSLAGTLASLSNVRALHCLYTVCTASDLLP